MDMRQAETRTWCGQMNRLSRCSLHQEQFTFGELKEAYNPECLVPTVKHRRSCVMVRAAISWYSILLVSLLPFMAELLQRSMCVDGLGNQVYPTIQTLFLKNDAAFQDDIAPLHTVGIVQSLFEEHEGELQHLP
jgi:hypothetical protein